MIDLRKSVILLALVIPACSSGSPGASGSPAAAGSPAPEAQTSEAWTRPHPGIALEVTRTDLVSDRPGALTLDPNLVNPWGLAFNPKGPAWVSNNHTGTSTVYDARGDLLLTVTVPTPVGGTPPSAPTGQVFNPDARDFAGDRFLFVTEDGTISGWQPGTGTTLRFTATDGAIYKGVALAEAHDGMRLYAADFHNAKIDVFDSHFRPIAGKRFQDCFLPDGYAPFNLIEHDGDLLVAFAKQGPEKTDEEAGAGFGFVDRFDAHGHLLQRLVSRGALNAPWGLAIAPHRFGSLGGALLVGNFGDGRINAYALESHRGWTHVTPVGALGDAHGKPLVIDGLWAIVFGPGAGGASSKQLYFTAGPDDESHGVFGRLEARD